MSSTEPQIAKKKKKKSTTRHLNGKNEVHLLHQEQRLNRGPLNFLVFHQRHTIEIKPFLCSLASMGHRRRRMTRTVFSQKAFGRKHGSLTLEKHSVLVLPACSLRFHVSPTLGVIWLWIDTAHKVPKNIEGLFLLLLCQKYILDGHFW